jgi:hypothetical protein
VNKIVIFAWRTQEKHRIFVIASEPYKIKIGYLPDTILKQGLSTRGPHAAVRYILCGPHTFFFFVKNSVTLYDEK